MLDLFFFEQVAIFPSEEQEVHKMSIYSINSRGRYREGWETRWRVKHNLRIFFNFATDGCIFRALKKPYN